MRDLRRKFTVAALAASAAFGGLATAGTAHAATANVQIRICNNNPASLKFYIVGYNDHGDWGGSRFWEAGPHQCTTAADYWWRTNSSVEFHYVRTGTGWNWYQLYVPKANDGSTQEFSVS
jgi:hypothetical protein